MKNLKSIIRSLLLHPVKSQPIKLRKDIFNEIFETNYWRGESRSGEGSDLLQTAIIRETLPGLLRELNINTMLDIPCGDFFWMRHIDLPCKYIGADIVSVLIKDNQQKFGGNRHSFVCKDLCTDTLPRADLVFSRDVMVHLSYNDIKLAIANVKNSGASWILTTTFTNRDSNTDIRTGDWRTLNLQIPPFNFPEPIKMLNEGCTQYGGDYSDKSLGLWNLNDIHY